MHGTDMGHLIIFLQPVRNKLIGMGANGRLKEAEIIIDFRYNVHIQK